MYVNFGAEERANSGAESSVEFCAGVLHELGTEI